MERVLPFAYQVVSKEFETMNLYYKEKQIQHNVQELQFAEYYYENFNLLLEQIENQTTRELEVEINLESSSVNGNPGIEIYFNTSKVLTKDVPEGPAQIKFKIDQTSDNTIKFKLINKNANDTLVDNNQIVKDKCLVFKSLYINGVDILQDPEFFNNYIKYVEDNQFVEAKYGLWKNNSEIQISYPGLFKTWYNKHSKKNSRLEAHIISELTVSTRKSDEFYRNELVKLLKNFEY